MTAVQLVVPAELAGHVAVALELYAARCREQAYAVPDGLLDLREWAVVVHRGLSSPEAPPPLDSASVVGVLLRLPVVAERLGCSLSTVKRLVADGELPAVLFHGQRRVRTEDLDAFIAGLPGGSFRDRLEQKETA